LVVFVAKTRSHLFQLTAVVYIVLYMALPMVPIHSYGNVSYTQESPTLPEMTLRPLSASTSQSCRLGVCDESLGAATVNSRRGRWEYIEVAAKFLPIHAMYHSHDPFAKMFRFAVFEK
jgi:hypothetical protein